MVQHIKTYTNWLPALYSYLYVSGILGILSVHILQIEVEQLSMISYFSK
jgi:hypothetical protein